MTNHALPGAFGVGCFEVFSRDRSRAGQLIGCLVMWSLLSCGTQVRASEEDCLLTDDGVPVKVILKEDAAVYAQPDKSGSSRPARIFDWFYALPTEKNGKEKLRNDFYHVAQGAAWTDAVGWVHKDAIVEWNHREAVSFKNDPDRERVLFYSSREDLSKYMLETKDAKNPQPLSQEPQDLGGGFFVMPVLDVASIGSGGTEKPVYHVAYLHGGGSPQPSGGAPRSASSAEQGNSLSVKDFQEQFTLDIVFVIDSTASMNPWIAGVRETVKRAATTIADHPQLKGHVRFGLVAYRDRLATESANRSIEYLTRIFCKLAEGVEPQAFLQKVEGVDDADEGSEDWPEDVIAGMKVALEEMDWNPIASRHLILIGDASAQDNMEDPRASGASRFAYKNYYKKSLDYILSLAQASGQTREVAESVVTIHALRIKPEDFPSDWAKCERDFQKLAAGRDYPGVYRVYEVSAVGSFIQDLIAQLEHPIVNTGRVVDPAQAAVLSDPGQKKQLAGLLNAPILNFVSSPNGSGQAAGFASGWACKIDVGDNFQLEPHVLVTRGRMETFLTALDSIIRTIEKAREPGTGDVAKAVQEVLMLATLVLYGDEIGPDTELAGVLTKALGLPIKSDIFSMSIQRLKNMTQENFDDWVARVRATQQIIRANLDDRDRWRSVGSSTSEADKHAFIKVSDMP